MDPVVAPQDEPPIDCLTRHCRMYLYASAPRPEFLTNETAQDFFTFGILHLLSTMFIVTDDGDHRTQGLFHKVLDPLGHANLLDEIDQILDRPLGQTTLRTYLRQKRNTLATHGTHRFSAQRAAVQAVTSDASALDQFEDAMTAMDAAVAALLVKLEPPSPIAVGPKKTQK